jgi:hypothetical protein
VEELIFIVMRYKEYYKYLLKEDNDSNGIPEELEIAYGRGNQNAFNLP